jgi:hypothetical protein
MNQKNFFVPTPFKIIAFVPCYLLLYNVLIVSLALFGVAWFDSPTLGGLPRFSGNYSLLSSILGTLIRLSTPNQYIPFIIAFFPAYLSACVIVYYIKKSKPQKQVNKK